MVMSDFAKKWEPPPPPFPRPLQFYKNCES